MAAATVDEVIATPALHERAPRSCDRAAEERAFEELKRALAGSPRAVLQKLADVALELCNAQSSGISLLEEAGGRRVFRWHAVAGEFRSLLWNTLPREFSPCGTVLDRQAAQLMVDPERYFTPLAQITPRVSEVLLVPFSVDGEIVGTVWLVAHDAARRFDREDHRIVSALTRFAAAAYEMLVAFRPDDIRYLSRMHHAPRRSKKRS